MATMLGMPDVNTDEMTKKLEEILPVIKQVNEQFKNPVSSISCHIELVALLEFYHASYAMVLDVVVCACRLFRVLALG